MGVCGRGGVVGASGLLAAACLGSGGQGRRSPTGPGWAVSGSWESEAWAGGVGVLGLGGQPPSPSREFLLGGGGVQARGAVCPCSCPPLPTSGRPVLCCMPAWCTLPKARPRLAAPLRTDARQHDGHSPPSGSPSRDGGPLVPGCVAGLRWAAGPFSSPGRCLGRGAGGGKPPDPAASPVPRAARLHLGSRGGFLARLPGRAAQGLGLGRA